MKAGKDRASSPRREPLARFYRLLRVPSGARRQSMAHHQFDGILETRRSGLDLERMEPLKDIASQGQERRVRVVEIDNVFPQSSGKLKARFALPGDRECLQAAALRLIENAAAEQERQRHGSIFKTEKILARRNSNVKSAGNLERKRSCIFECGKHRRYRCPVQRLQRQAPAVRLA